MALHNGAGLQGCISGQYCPRGTHVEVYDVLEPEVVGKVGEYDGEQEPAVHIKMHRDLGVVRTQNGFKVYRLEPLP